jgi:hypothetical protein
MSAKRRATSSVAARIGKPITTTRAPSPADNPATMTLKLATASGNPSRV